MGLFGKKEQKPFISNNRLVEIVSCHPANLEEEIERRYLYRNVESVDFERDMALVKYKDLKVRSEFKVKKMREEMEREAGLDLGR